MQQIRPGLRQQGMDHRAAPDDLAHRLRAGIDAGDLPAPDLADVQRRADRRARRRTVRTAAVAGASALALVGVLVVAVPAISDVVAAREKTSTALADRPQGITDPDGDLTDPSVWSTLPPVRWYDDPYLSPGAMEAAVGSGSWIEPTVTMVGPWNIPECGPDLESDTAQEGAALGVRPSSTHVEPWATLRLGADGAQAPLDPTADPFDAFAAVSALRWGGAPNDAGSRGASGRAGAGTGTVADGVRAAGAWWHAALRAEAACPGAEVVHGTVPDEGAVPAGELPGPRSGPPPLPGSAASRHHAPDHAEAHAQRDELMTALRALPRRQRAVLVLRHHEGLDDAEIADLLGVGTSTVRSNAARGIAALRAAGLRGEIRGLTSDSRRHIVNTSPGDLPRA